MLSVHSLFRIDAMPTVLVIEDDTDLLYLYRTALSQRGYEVVEANNSGEAMEMLETPDFVPALVFVDMGMPDAPGTRVINYMRSEDRFDETRIVVVTANEQYRNRVADKGVSHFLVKPVTISQLIDIADELTA
jgi:CheY-like chemotaxis protein